MPPIYMASDVIMPAHHMLPFPASSQSCAYPPFLTVDPHLSFRGSGAGDGPNLGLSPRPPADPSSLLTHDRSFRGSGAGDGLRPQTLRRSSPADDRVPPSVILTMNPLGSYSQQNRSVR